MSSSGERACIRMICAGCDAALRLIRAPLVRAFASLVPLDQPRGIGARDRCAGYLTDRRDCSGNGERCGIAE